MFVLRLGNAFGEQYVAPDALLEHQFKEQYESLFSHRNPWRYLVTEKQQQKFARHLNSVANFVQARRLSPSQVLIGRKNEKSAIQREKDFIYLQETWNDVLYFLGWAFRELRGKGSSASVLLWEKLDKDSSSRSIKKIQEAFAKIERKRGRIAAIYQRASRDKASCRGDFMQCQQRFALVALHADYLNKAIELVGSSIGRLENFVVSKE